MVRKFGLPRQTDLAHEDEIERRLQGGGDLGGHRDAATRQREDHRIETRKSLKRQLIGVNPFFRACLPT